MAGTKEISVVVDVVKLDQQLATKREALEAAEDAFSVESTVFVLGFDPRVGTKIGITTPEVKNITVLMDGLDNPFLKINWQSTRYDVDSNGVIGFNVYRKRISRINILGGGSLRKRTDELRPFDQRAFDRLSRGISARGHFSEERKASSYIRTSLLPLSVNNFCLALEQESAQSRFDSSLNLSTVKTTQLSAPRFEQSFVQEPLNAVGRFENFFNNRVFQKIAYVDYTSFLAKEKQKFVFVQEQEFISVSYKDKNVGYGEVFEYYVTAVTKTSEESPGSNRVIVTVTDRVGVRPPKSLRAKQLNERQIQLVTTLDSRDKVNRIILFRRSEDELTFKKLGVSPNRGDCINVVDGTVAYNGVYTYRVFSENIFGTLSEPAEVTVTSTVQRITPQTRSNNLKIPIISVVQDQNSNFTKTTISPNDDRVSFYQLERRDLSINEKSFAVPGKDTTGFGGDGWESKLFRVERTRQILNREVSDPKSLLQRRNVSKEIVFIDDTVEIGHIYRYRTRGIDLFGNPTSYAFDQIRVVGKKSLRSPINLKSEILRGSPFRVKISWNDDNLSTSFTAEELFQGLSFPQVSSDLTSEQRDETPPDTLSVVSVRESTNSILSTIDASLGIERETTEEEEEASATQVAVPNEDAVKYLYKVQRRRKGEMIYQSFPLTANLFLVDESPTLDAVDHGGEKKQDVFAKEANITTEDSTIRVSDRNNVRRPFNIPEFLAENDIYFYRVGALAPDGSESNFTDEFEISTVPDLSDPLDFRAEILDSKVIPLVSKLTWSNDPLFALPDHWIIERKFDVDNDTFQTIGRAYIKTEFLDKDLQQNNTYVYRIKSIDVLGRESAFFETRLTI